jgi:hypothetical protein
MTDKTTKALLFAITLGLWANAVPNIINPAHAWVLRNNTCSDVVGCLKGIYEI